MFSALSKTVLLAVLAYHVATNIVGLCSCREFADAPDTYEHVGYYEHMHGSLEGRMPALDAKLKEFTDVFGGDGSRFDKAASRVSKLGVFYTRFHAAHVASAASQSRLQLEVAAMDELDPAGVHALIDSLSSDAEEGYKKLYDALYVLWKASDQLLRELRSDYWGPHFVFFGELCGAQWRAFLDAAPHSVRALATRKC